MSLLIFLACQDYNLSTEKPETEEPETKGGIHVAAADGAPAPEGKRRWWTPRRQAAVTTDGSVTGQSPYLYFSRFQSFSLIDVDLLRVRVQFSK